ncbi:MAG: translation initiation factor IF-2 N-terminal domain-containing protein, partial [Prevotella sp.]|nr:translation initiation factor IF-2 N-terminal domain-containing protein [Prevotella sp.]
MGVRLNKILSELNIGLQTAVDFLKKKSELGEVKDDISPNTKISDQQYEALVNEFSTDKAVKSQAGQLFPKKPKEKKVEKPEKEIVNAEELLEQRPQFKPLGKIDLDSIGKPKAAATVAPEPTPEPVVEQQEEVVEPPVEEEVPVQEAEPEVIVEQSEPVVAAQEPETAEAEAPVAEPEADVEVAEPEPAKAEPEQPALAKTPGDLKQAPQLNVLGKIDLSALNQSTRPKKKTKEERRKEREEKAAGERKKRERIRTDKVDIEAAARQANQQQGGKKNNNMGGKNAQQQQQQQGGKKNKKNRPVKPLEVDDEAVARQVKETLARLTSKTNQNKKGAKYRKEKRDAVAERMSEEMAAEAAESKVLKLTEFVTVSELATMMNVGVNQVIGTCMSIGIMVSINQ